MTRLLTISLIILATQFATDVRAASYKDDLEEWLLRDLTPYVSQRLTSQPRFKNESIRFVVLADENPQSVSSKLALNIRDRLRDSVANEAGIRIVWQRDLGGASETQNIDCTKDDVQYYVGVEVTEGRDGLINVDIRALDIEDQSWVAGFTRSWRGHLNAVQRRQLNQEAMDPSFRGNRGAPYDDSQFDLLAAHLAHDLGCALLRQTAGEYVVSGANSNVEDEAESAMLELVSNNLSDFRAAQFSDVQSAANAVIEGKAHQIDDELYQYWITIRPKDVHGDLQTIGASAYIRVREKYSAARLIPSITIPLAKSDESFLEPIRIVELRNRQLCPSANLPFGDAQVHNSSYFSSATDCYALEVDASDDVIVFFLNHQLNNGLVRLSAKSCDGRPDVRVARLNERLHFPLPIDSLMSDAWVAASDWELHPDKDTYYVVATRKSKAAHVLSKHIRQLPNRCSASVRSGLDGRDLQHWMDGFSSIAEQWKQSIDWRVVRVDNVY